VSGRLLVTLTTLIDYIEEQHAACATATTATPD